MDALQVIARIHTGLPEKFGVPRQSGLVPQLRGRIVFEPAYRNPDAVRGLEDFSHLWLIWQFSEAVRQDWSPTVRPPRLGGNRRMGVFATRSPFRPSALVISQMGMGAAASPKTANHWALSMAVTANTPWSGGTSSTDS